MGYEAKLLADSRGPSGHRITTMQLTLPRIMLAELNTHRTLSRNSASSRAIPIETMLEKVNADPFVPFYWGKKQKGMQADEELNDKEKEVAEVFWREGLTKAVDTVNKMNGIGIHKQLTNRLLEPFLFHTVIVTGTEWENAFNLRRDRAAQPEIRKGFDMLWDVYENSQPRDLDYGEWHLPLVFNNDMARLIEDGYKPIELAKISCGRCGRISYLTHDGVRDPKADVAMVDTRFVPLGHMSPLEHAARPMTPDELALFARAATKVVNVDGDYRLVADPEGQPSYFCGNVQGFVQYRKLIPGESVFRFSNR